MTTTDLGGAACHDHPQPDLWFLEDRRHREAKAICATCPVRQACLRMALTERIGYGIWGGTDHDQRALMLNTTPSAMRRLSHLEDFAPGGAA